MTSQSDVLASWLFRRLDVPACPPIDLEALATRMGVSEVYETEMAEDGRLEPRGLRAIVYLRRGLGRGRRRFTLAHELAHWALAHPASPRTVYRRIYSGGDEERLCDEIAASLLMPRQWTLKFRSLPQNLTILRLMAKRADVSLSAALVRNREVNHWHKSLGRFSLDEGRWRLQGVSGVPIEWHRSVRSAPSTHTLLSELPFGRDCERTLPLCVSEHELDVRAQINRTRYTALALVELDSELSTLPSNDHS